MGFFFFLSSSFFFLLLFLLTVCSAPDRTPMSSEEGRVAAKSRESHDADVVSAAAAADTADASPSLRDGERPPPSSASQDGRNTSSQTAFVPGDVKQRISSEPHHHHHHHPHPHPHHHHHHHHNQHPYPHHYPYHSFPGSRALDASKIREPLNREMYRIPSYAGWFSWGKIHTLERQSLPEFFDGRSLSRTPKVYKEYREFIINKYREMHPPRSLTFTELRKMLVGDVNLLRKVFDFLEYWGLINFGTHKPENEAISQVENGCVKIKPPDTTVVKHEIEAPMSLPSCETRKTTSTIERSAPLTSPNKAEENAGGACLVEPQNHVKQSGTASSPVPDDWTTQELLRLLEGLAKYGDNWNHVAHYVATKSRAECITRFIRLPFGDQFLTNVGMEFPHQAASSESMAKASQEEGSGIGSNLSTDVHQKTLREMKEGDPEIPSKRSRLTPLADSSNPILAQAAFLAAMVGPRVASAAAQAAVAALSEEDPISTQVLTSLSSCNHAVDKESLTSSNTLEPTGESMNPEHDGDNNELRTKKGDQENVNGIPRPAINIDVGSVIANAKSLLDQEEREVEHLMTSMIEKEIKQLHSQIEYVEELEFLLEKEVLQVEKSKFQVLGDWIRYSHYHYNSGP